MSELALLKSRTAEQAAVYGACDISSLPRRHRLLAQAWLSEVGLSLARLELDVAQLEEPKPSQVGLRQAWSRYWQVFTALSPIVQPVRAGSPSPPGSAASGLKLVASRLLIVFVFLIAQLVAAIALIVVAVRLFLGFDPQTALTAAQWQARGPARAQIERVAEMLSDAQRQFDAAPAITGAPPPEADVPRTPTPTPAVPDVTVIRSEVESLAASLPESGLSTIDLRTANSWIDAVLRDLDRDPPAYAAAASSLTSLAKHLSANQEKAPPSIIWITILGSLLGMITITTHLNWKYRNRWDTVGFLPWYLTKLIAAPVISLCAVGLLSQVTFTNDLGSVTGISNMGLLGASPLLIFSVAILTGLFSNRVFDWLKSVANPTAPPAPASAPTASSSAPVTERSAADT